ncbi:MAG: TetR/AcrR family transcriptional regulator [Candidatus Accumulibacter sp.]|jgi:AcrR family transcriptional regulator|nr:TetR/AcrR family transcriptional regulator [Accumulibacter sp.]
MGKSEKDQAILQAAASVFLTHGFSATTTDMIQREAGVSKATMYARFPNKEALFMAVVERECATMFEAFQAIQATPGDIAGMLAEIGMSYLKFLLSPTALALFRVVSAEVLRFPDLGPRFYRAGPGVGTAVVARRLSEAARAGEIDVQWVGVDTAASLFLGMVRAEGHLECLTHPDARPSAVQMERWVQVAVSTFLRAFGVASASPVR